MRRPVCYDVTRLLTRILNSTPNGIDRVDHALADHFLSGDPASTFASMATGLGARLIGGPGAAEAVNGIAAHWGETGRAVEDDPVFRRVADWICGRAPRQKREVIVPSRRPALRADLVRRIAGWTGRHGVPRAKPLRALPNNAAYINVSQFPLWVASSFEWLEARRDVKAAFFVHDLLPILLPEYFREAEFERHRKRLRNVARFASAALVTTRTVAADLKAHMVSLGRHDMPVFVAPTPIAPLFAGPRTVDPDLCGHPYFVLCSTIEPRKNHLMILAVWRALVGRLGADAPKLVLVGTRGWHYDSIVDLIERSPGLKSHVLEVGGLSTPGLKRLIDNARGVLMPTFGEGYGLPVHEALAAGAPVIASDIPVFREVEAGHLTLLSPLAGEAWLETIAGLSERSRVDPSERHVHEGWGTYFSRLDAFIDAL